MSKLSKLYEIQKGLKEIGIALSEEQEAQLRTLEEEIIKKDILPVLTEQIEPALSQVQRELVLVVDYVPGEELKVHLSRKRNIADVLPDAVEITLDPTVEHRSMGKHKAKIDEKAAATRLRITMPDGQVIEDHKAAESLRLAIIKIGPERVRTLGLTLCKVPFISNNKDAKYGHAQVSVGNGWYVITHSNTRDKKKMLDKIAKLLHLNIKVEIV